MAVTPFDSAMLRDLFTDPEIASLLTDSADVRAMLLVEGQLAKVQGALGVIPAESAGAIHRASMEVLIDAGALTKATGANGVCVPALVDAFRGEMQAPEHAQYAHWGATSQDIIDTGLALRLRQALGLIEKRIDVVLAHLGALADAHAQTPMAARTYGQVATVTSFGAVVASWGEGLLALRRDLDRVREAALIVTLSGAAGTLGAMGPQGPAVRAALAEALKLRDPMTSPHAGRAHIGTLAAWLNGVTQVLGKMAADLLLLTRTGEVGLGGGGASSTMPQKQNPVAPSVIAALAAQANGVNAVVQGAVVHRDQRDAGAWFAEWLSLPQLVMATGAALARAGEMQIMPDAARLAAQIDDGSGLIYAEALSFALAADMPRPEAQAQVKAWCRIVQAQGGHLRDHAGPYRSVFDPLAQLGEAPDIARRFATAVRET